MRLVFITTMSGAPWGGSEELWSRAAARMLVENHDVAASVVPWPKLSCRIEKLAKSGVEIYVREDLNRSLRARIWRKIASNGSKDYQWLTGKRPALVVISQGGIADGLEWMMFCREERIPFVSLVQCNAESFWPWDETAEDLATAYKSADRVFFVSQKNLELLQRQIGTELSNSTVVRNPFNVAADEPPDWPIPNGSWNLACVARLEPAAKGQDILFEVLSLPKWRDRPLKVNLYGSGPCELSLKKLAGNLRLSSVHFHNHVDDVRSIWEGNQLLVLPSRYEGLPLALVEASLCARPSLVTDVSDARELCVDDETGFVASAPTMASLDEALERAWFRRERWQEMGQAARARAESLIPTDPVGDFCKQLMECVSPPQK